MFEWLSKTDKKTAPGSSATGASRSPAASNEGGVVACFPTIDIALQHHQAGRLSEAEVAYRAVLAAEPGNIDALHFLGVIAYQLGNHEQAAELISRALTLNASNAPAHNNLGNVFRAQGKLDEALVCFEKAVALQPEYVDAHLNLGAVFRAQGKLEEAVACYQRALSLAPDFPTAHFNLGNALNEQGRLEEAIACYRTALELRPDLVEAHFNLGNALRERGDLNDAVACYEAALSLAPEDPMFRCSLGHVLNDQGRPEEAIACYRKALELRPDLAEAHANLGNALLSLGSLKEAEESYRYALRLQPEFPQARLCYALFKLLVGDHETGFLLFESRFEENALPKAYAGLRARLEELQTTPRWQGEDAADKALLVWADQGLGDTLMMARYLSRLKARGVGKLIVHCQAALVRIIQTIAGVDTVIPLTQPVPFGEFDCHCPLTSLPLVFRARLETIPRQVPYLLVPEELGREWARRLAGIAAPRVGLVWGGRKDVHVLAPRSIRLEQFAPLLEIGGVTYLSLQKGDDARQIKQAGGKILDWMDECSDMLETAALIEQLDLVISIDTSVAHLAGALGKPVWLLLRYESEWRWMLGREDSPWYPTMRIFRQRTRGNWDDVMVRVTAALKAYSETGH